MSIATEKLLPASERFQLIKITPARYIGDDLASAGSGVYTTTFAFEAVSDVQRNGVSLTKVSTLTANDQYTFDEATRLISVKLASAPNEDTNVVVAFYQLFFTGTKYRYVAEDPENPVSVLNPLREWKPLLDKYPNTSNTIKNIRDGILTYSSASVSIVNDNYDFEKYFTINDSFSKKEIKIWQCINSIDNIKKVFTGSINSINISNSKITFGVFDPLVNLGKNAYFGDYDFEAIYQRLSYSYPNLNPADDGKPIPYWTAKSTSLIRIGGSLTTGVPYQAFVSFQDAPSAVCINADIANEPSTSNNRNYGLCRVGPNGLKVLNFGTTVRQIAYLGNSRFYKITGGNLAFSDQFSYGGVEYVISYAGADFSYSGNTYNTIVQSQGHGIPPLVLPPTNLASVTPAETPPAIYYDDGSTLRRMLWGDDYTYGWTNTYGGNRFINIILTSGANSYETNWSINPIDPNSHAIKYMVTPADTFTHANYIKRLCEDSGIATNAASFSQADSDFTANAYVSVPNIGETSYRKTFEYIEDMLKSTLGYLTVNDSFEVEYILLNAPGGSGELIDDNISWDISSKIDYNDIKTTITAKNPHIIKSTDSERASSAKAQHLHGINENIEFIHSVNDITGRLPQILASVSNRRRIYDFNVATQLIDASIGDDITYNGENLKIINISKNGSYISVSAEDLKGF